jgi:hypothetical protein
LNNAPPRIAREHIAAGLQCDTGVFTGAALYTDVATVWSDAAAPIIGNVETAANVIESNTGMRPNALACNALVWSYILANTGVLARFPGANLVNRTLLADSIASILGLDKIFVSRVKYNSAVATPGTFTPATVWSNSYVSLALVATEGAPTGIPCVGRTLQWSEDGMGVVVESRYEDSATLARTDVVRTRENVSEKIFDPYFAHLLKVD